MLKIKKSRADYSAVKVCSDIHYGHDRNFLYEPRGFKTSEAHTKWMDDQFAQLDPDTLLICLGDVGLTIGPKLITDFLYRIPCETLMVWGNHNSGVFQAYKAALPVGFEQCEVYPLRIAPNVTMLGESFLLSIDYDRFFCTHMSPLIYPEQAKGYSCLCGHSHGNLKQINPGRDDFGKILDCGVENAIKQNGTAFFDIDEVASILASKKKSSIDHH
jgi:hypothetical protein